jgi:hypothetical protein
MQVDTDRVIKKAEKLCRHYTFYEFIIIKYIKMYFCFLLNVRPQSSEFK